MGARHPRPEAHAVRGVARRNRSCSADTRPEQPSEFNEAISALTPESAVTVTGLVVADERVKLGGLEIQLASLSVDSPAEPELPVTPESALDKRIDWRYLDLRRPDRRLIFEVQSQLWSTRCASTGTNKNS